jgi:hypothetical protein
VALSRLSNHPVSRAMVESAPHMDGDVSVLSFEQVRRQEAVVCASRSRGLAFEQVGAGAVD